MEIVVDRFARDEHENHLPIVEAVDKHPVQRLDALIHDREVTKRHP